MPHITLVYPFRPKSIFAALIEPLTAACSEHSPFEVELATLRSFRHRSSYTVWLAPEPREALVRLQMALGLIVPDCEKVRRHAGGFTPHLSVKRAFGRTTGWLDADPFPGVRNQPDLAQRPA
jgi:2'-5' RNA ligase